MPLGRVTDHEDPKNYISPNSLADSSTCKFSGVEPCETVQMLKFNK